jgi:hypothetical protein
MNPSLEACLAGLSFEIRVQQRRHCTCLDVNNDDVHWFSQKVRYCPHAESCDELKIFPDRPTCQPNSKLVWRHQGPHGAHLSDVPWANKQHVNAAIGDICLCFGGSSWCVLALLWISDSLMLLWYHEQRRELQTIMTSYIFCQLTQIWFVNLMIFSSTRKVRTKAIQHIHGLSMACHLHQIRKRTSVPAIMLWLSGWAAHESTLSDKGINLFSAGLFSSQPLVSSLKHGIPRVYFQATFSKKSRWDKKR